MKNSDWNPGSLGYDFQNSILFLFFHDGGPYHIETDFYKIGASVKQELILTSMWLKRKIN